MTWSSTQQRMAVMAARSAGWTDEQRYMAMRYVGCPTADGSPSVKSPGNTNRHFELYMAIAEGHARMIGNAVRSPKGQESWHAAASSSRTRTLHLAKGIAAEAQRRIPEVFAEGFLSGFVKRMTANDPAEFAGAALQPRSIDDCDDAQTYRIIEGLKAWVAREMLKRDLFPESFRITNTQRDQFFARAKSNKMNRKGRSAA